MEIDDLRKANHGRAKESLDDLESKNENIIKKKRKLSERCLGQFLKAPDLNGFTKRCNSICFFFFFFRMTSRYRLQQVKRDDAKKKRKKIYVSEHAIRHAFKK